MAKEKKDKFDMVDSNYKDAVNGMNGEEIRLRIAQVAIDLEDLLKAKSEDGDLAQKIELAKEAGEQYRDGIKASRQKIKYAREVLKGKGTTVKVAAPLGNRTTTNNVAKS